MCFEYKWWIFVELEKELFFMEIVGFLIMIGLFVFFNFILFMNELLV